MNKDPGFHRAVDGVQIEDDEFDKQPFLLSDGLTFQVHFAFQDSEKLGMVVEFFPDFPILLLDGNQVADLSRPFVFPHRVGSE